MNKNSKLYISDVAECEKNAPEYGDAEVLIAGEKDEKKEVGNDKHYQGKDYASK